MHAGDTPALGVGLVFFPELAALFEDAGLVGVLEVEPQAFWEKVRTPGGFGYRPNDALLRGVARLPQARLLHGVGQPVGGSVDDPVEYADALKQAVDLLDPAWASEHLSFNRIAVDGTCREAGFLLPPRQSPAGVRQAVRNIGRYARAIGRPFAFETGVNYLQPRADELDDGACFGAIADQAGCGILLDLHNLWCNERNGRQCVAGVLEQMPLERVWEVHLAGGMELGGYWLDAHSGGVPPALLELAARVVPRLPNLGAIVFEILPQHLARIGIDGVRRQLVALGELWAMRAARRVTVPPHVAHAPPAGERGPGSVADRAEVAAWECSLVAALNGRAPGDPRFAGLRCDPGVAVLRQLIGDARRSNLARAFRYTTTLLLLEREAGGTLALLDAYFATQAPDAFAAIEADHFAGFLRGRSDVLSRIPHLAEVLAFEHALVRASVHAESTDLVWSSDPTAILAALDEGRAPPPLPPVRSTMRIVPA